MAEVKLDLSDIKGNSFKEKEGKKSEVKPVVSKKDIISQKKTPWGTFVENFMQGDADDIKNWFIDDILIPGIKNTILDALGMLFFKDSRREYTRGQSGYDRERVSYNSYYKSDRRRDNYEREERKSKKIDYKNIVLKDKEKAKRVVDEMYQRIDDYDQVSIAEMLDSMELTGSYNDNNWGWTSKKDIGIRRVSNGWLIDVADAEPID